MVGRISAQIDTARLKQDNGATGAFGLLEAVNDPEVFTGLFNAAENWLRENGRSKPHANSFDLNSGANWQTGQPSSAV